MMRSRTFCVFVLLLATACGCDERDQRLAEMAREAANRQAEQNRQMADLQKQVAEGSKRLVEADAQARGEMNALQRDLQQSQSEVGRQRDLLENDRREIASQRHLDPIIASAIMDTGMVLACLLPLLLAGYALRCVFAPGQTDSVVAEVLVREITTDEPLLLPPPRSMSAITSDVQPSTDKSAATE